MSKNNIFSPLFYCKIAKTVYKYSVIRAHLFSRIGIHLRPNWGPFELIRVRLNRSSSWSESRLMRLNGNGDGVELASCSIEIPIPPATAVRSLVWTLKSLQKAMASKLFLKRFFKSKTPIPCPYPCAPLLPSSSSLLESSIAPPLSLLEPLFSPSLISRPFFSSRPSHAEEVPGPAAVDHRYCILSLSLSFFYVCSCILLYG